MTESADEAPAAVPREVIDLGGVEMEGQAVDQVTLNIDYRIIEHFSKNLYSSENKAVEELVSNGFDAFAERVYIYIPGPQTGEHLVVWDDGHSMDVDGLKNLWLIAESPKRDDRVRRSPDDGKERKLIGKFGIGKLASYTVGNRIIHLCRYDDRFLLVFVDYAEIHGKDGEGGADLEHPLRKPIVEIEEEQARAFVEGLFDGDEEPDALDLFDEPSWTLAVVSDLKVTLKEGRLTWVLGNGMPLRPDFRVWVNDDRVTPRIEEDATQEWEFDAEKIKESLSSHWEDAVDEGEVEGAVVFDQTAALDHGREEVPYIQFPNLGDVWGHVRLFDRSLKKGRVAEQGRSQGFFIVVLGRLINPRDDTFLLHPPQYGTFNRSQFIIHADELDQDLLADRSGVQEDTPRVRELEVLQRALYQAARNELERMEEEEGDFRSLLPTGSRVHYRQPLMALLTATLDEVPEDFEISNPPIDRTTKSVSDRVASLSGGGTGFEVNTRHPFFTALKARLGDSSKKSRAFDRWYDLFAVSDLLFEGHLHDAGLARDEVEWHMEWRDDLYREMAKSFEASSLDLLAELHNASFKGDEEFEEAIAAVLDAMGFAAEKRGGSGEEDIHVVATLGPDSYKLTFEAKGSENPVRNSDADVAGAARHRENADADHAVIVAREFVGFSDDPYNADAALYGECETTDGVSIMTTEALGRVFEVVQKFAYRLDDLEDVFIKLETPGEKLDTIRELEHPMEGFDYRELIESIWELQQGEAAEDVVPYRTVYHRHSEWKESMEFDEFERKIAALETFASPLVVTRGENIHLLQDPDHITEKIRDSLEAEPD